MIQKAFLKKTVKLGNSSGVILPKSLLGAYVKVIVVSPPMNIKKDVLKLLEPILEEILGAYLIKKGERRAEILAVSTNLNQHIKKQNYEIDIVPLQILKKSLKEKKETKEKISQAQTIFNKRLLAELRKDLR